MDGNALDIIYEAHRQCREQLNRNDIVNWVEDILAILVPEYKRVPVESKEDLVMRIDDCCQRLSRFLSLNQMDASVQICRSFCERILHIKLLLDNDAQAIYEGDPAASSVEEVRHAYLSFYAIAAYRIAHVLTQLKVKIIPRIISEHAHGKTGIDIHPAAQIGERLCIDHGTGVVIGETAIIGSDVKIYQGVTLGALSVDKSSSNTKRHPTVGDNVVIYAGATILGGDTVIGNDSIIGGNVWLVDSVEAGSKVYYKSPENV